MKPVSCYFCKEEFEYLSEFKHHLRRKHEYKKLDININEENFYDDLDQKSVIKNETVDKSYVNFRNKIEKNFVKSDLEQNHNNKADEKNELIPSNKQGFSHSNKPKDYKENVDEKKVEDDTIEKDPLALDDVVDDNTNDKISDSENDSGNGYVY